MVNFKFLDQGLQTVLNENVREYKNRHEAVVFFNDTAPTEIYTELIVGSVRCV